MTQIDWSKAPEWANAVVRGHDSQTMYFVEQFGGFSERRQMVESGQDDGMNLPEGKTCADCNHCRRCTLMFGHIPADEVCDWYPSRFTEKVIASEVQS